MFDKIRVMKKGKKNNFGALLSSLLTFFFKYLYFLINIFIVIGEKTRLILVFPVKLLSKIRLPKVKTRLPKVRVKLPTIKIRQPSVKVPRIKLPRFRLKFDFLSLKLRYFLLGVVLTLLTVFLYQSYVFVKNLPAPNSIGKVNFPLSTHLYDRNGKLLYEIYREQNRTPVSLKELPRYVAQSTIAIEDKNFYRHGGVSLISGIFRAVKEMIIQRKIQGGSTITQQLVKSALLTPERTIQRKIKEIILAIWTEQLFTKEKILEMYLNQVPYGGSSYGIEEAAKTYFGKHASELTLEQAALLAGLPQAPSFYSPQANPDLAIMRRNKVLAAMKEQGYIDENAKIKSQNAKLETIPPKTGIKAPHFVFYTKSQLESFYGISTVEEGGLRVTTTLDLDIQEEGEKILKEELEKIKNLNVTNGAILVTRPSTGEILAMVGSVDYFASPSGAFNVTTALRQPGSSIKPIMYSLALEKGYTSASIIDDSPVIFNTPGAESYKPVNYDNRFHGKIPLRFALANSYNVPAVKVLSTIGVENFINQATKMGIETWTDRSRYGLSLTLGGGEVTMLNMAEAFGVLANLGYRVPHSYFIKIESVDKKILRENSPLKVREVDQGISYIISDILADNFARQWAFGSASALEIPGYKVAVKTGTTNEKKDNWTIGYTPEFMVVIWVGNNNGEPMNPYLASGITGAAPIWSRMMSYLLKNYGNGKSWYEKPNNVVEKNCYFGRKEYFIKGTEKTASCGESIFNTTPTPTKSN